MANFKEEYLKGNIDINGIDDFVDLWHKKKPDVSLQDFLGLSKDEYQAFIKGTKHLKQELDRLKTKYEKTGSFLIKILI